jgi:hypothetical protein
LQQPLVARSSSLARYIFQLPASLSLSSYPRSVLATNIYLCESFPVLAFFVSGLNRHLSSRKFRWSVTGRRTTVTVPISTCQLRIIYCVQHPCKSCIRKALSTISQKWPLLSRRHSPPCCARTLNIRSRTTMARLPRRSTSTALFRQEKETPDERGGPSGPPGRHSVASFSSRRPGRFLAGPLDCAATCPGDGSVSRLRQGSSSPVPVQRDSPPRPCESLARRHSTEAKGPGGRHRWPDQPQSSRRGGSSGSEEI